MSRSVYCTSINIRNNSAEQVDEWQFNEDVDEEEQWIDRYLFGKLTTVDNVQLSPGEHV